LAVRDMHGIGSRWVATTARPLYSALEEKSATMGGRKFLPLSESFGGKESTAPHSFFKREKGLKQ